MMSTFKAALVLSGGGAKGAYEVGVVRALEELGIEIEAIAGASIGALNGGVLACAPSLTEGRKRLETLWQDLAAASPLDIQFPKYLLFLMAAGMGVGAPGVVAILPRLMQSAAVFNSAASRLNIELPFLNTLNKAAQFSLCSDQPLYQHMEKYLDESGLKTGLPLYVSVFESENPLQDLIGGVLAECGLSDTKASTFFHLQSLPENEQKNALLASAAIPLLFAPKIIKGKAYSDGGLGGWKTMQGNTPITPLLEAGYQTVIVTHLSDGALWSRHDFPKATVLEIRPQSSISRKGLVQDLLGFDEELIPSWIEQGYDDTIHCLKPVIDSGVMRHQWKNSENQLQSSLLSFEESDALLDSAMQRLRKKDIFMT